MELVPKEWDYIASGSANAVFEYVGKQHLFIGKVLRLRLNQNGASTQEIYNYLKSSIFDSLREYMVPVDIMEVSSEFLRILDLTLSLENVKLDLTEHHGLILKNIYKYKVSEYDSITLNKYYKFFIHRQKDHVLFEFKPKWLGDMLSHHLNCRNCLNAKMKNQKYVICHIPIVQGKRGIDSWCEEIQQQLSKRNDAIYVQEKLNRCLYHNYRLIAHLYKLQNNIPIHEILINLKSEMEVTEELQFNMTLRDVSIFLDLNTKQAFLLDLDKKSSSKWKNWKNQELKFQELYTRDLKLNCRFKTNS